MGGREVGEDAGMQGCMSTEAARLGQAIGHASTHARPSGIFFSVQVLVLNEVDKKNSKTLENPKLSPPVQVLVLNEVDKKKNENPRKPKTVPPRAGPGAE